MLLLEFPPIYQIKDSNRSIKGLEKALLLIKTCGINWILANAYHKQYSMCAQFFLKSHVLSVFFTCI